MNNRRITFVLSIVGIYLLYTLLLTVGGWLTLDVFGIGAVVIFSILTELNPVGVGTVVKRKLRRVELVLLFGLTVYAIYMTYIVFISQ